MIFNNLQNLWSDPGYSFDIGKPSKETEKPTNGHHNGNIFKPYDNIDNSNKNTTEDNPLGMDNITNEDLSDIYVNIHHYKPNVMIMEHEEDKEKTHKSDQHGCNSKDKSKQSKHNDLSYGRKNNIDGNWKEIKDNKKTRISISIQEEVLKPVST